MKWWSSEALILIIFLAIALKGYAVDLTPSYLGIQTGGGVGIVGVNVGWNFWSKKKWETDIIVGVTPAYDSGNAKLIVALKENFIPWKIRLNDTFILEPLSTNMYLTSILSNKFWGKQPSKYGPGYYGLSTKYRINIGVGQRISMRLPYHDRGKEADTLHSGKAFRTITAYYELSTCDIYILSACGNKYLKPSDWLQLCLGLRLTI